MNALWVNGQSYLTIARRIYHSIIRRILIIVAAVACMMLIGCDSHSADGNIDYKNKKQPVELKDMVMATGEFPLYDGTIGQLRLVMTEGEYLTEEYAGGPGGGIYPENYDGRYELRLYNQEGDLLNTLNLNDDWNYQLIRFSGKFELLYTDYNGDQCPDFTIGNYGSSNGDIYFLYTITMDNQIKKIYNGAIFESNRAPSLVFEHDLQDGTKQFMTYPYNNATGYWEHCFYTWEEASESFILSEVREETPDDERVVQDSSSGNQEHLDFYDDFEMYNTVWDNFKGFYLSEEWIGGEPYYQLLNEKEDIKIIVDRTQEKAVIWHAGRSMDYNMEFLLSGTSANTAIDIMDVTNDGRKDLIIYHGMGGTGVWEGRSDVLDLETFEIYPIDPVFRDLGSRISIKPLETTKDGLIICQVTDSNGIAYYTSVEADGRNSEEFSYTPREENSYYHITVDNDRKCLSVRMGIRLDPMISYIGELKSWLEYHPETKSFGLSKEYTVDIWDPVDYESK